MYILKEAKLVDISAEIKAMVEFLSARWVKVDNVAELFQLVAEAAKKNTESAISDNELSMFFLEFRQNRRTVLESFSEDAGILGMYDQVAQLFDSLTGTVHQVHSNGREMLYEAYSDTFKEFKKALTAEHLAHLKKAEPRGLRAMTKHYQANDNAWGHALDDEFTDRQRFTGADTGNGSDGGFVSRVSLISVVQEKDRHNEPVINTLLEAAYNHFVRLYTHNNTQAILADFAPVLPLVEAKQPVFKLEFNPAYKLTKVLMALAQEEWRGIASDNPEQEYLECVADRKKQKPLSPKELKERRAAAVAEISALFKKALKPETAKDAKKREERTAKEQKAVRNLLKTVS